LTLAAVDFLFCGCDYDYGCIQEVAQEPLFSLAWAFNVFFPERKLFADAASRFSKPDLRKSSFGGGRFDLAGSNLRNV